MQAALFGIGIFPPPAAGADIFAGLNGAGAGLAADGRKALVMKRIIGHLMAVNVIPYGFFGPVCQRIEFGHTMRGVVFTGERDLEIMNFPDPTPGPGEVVVEMNPVLIGYGVSPSR